MVTRSTSCEVGGNKVSAWIFRESCVRARSGLPTPLWGLGAESPIVAGVFDTSRTVRMSGRIRRLRSTFARQQRFVIGRNCLRVEEIMSTYDRDVVVIGAGIAGLYAVHRLRNELGMNVRGYERAPEPGGVWWHNRYPGARVDMEAKDYSYRFSPELRREWQWSELFPAQPEILSYLGHVADRFDLRWHFEFDTAVTSLTWDADAVAWIVATDNGKRCRARFVVSCAGSMSAPKEPEFPGLATFRGAVYPTYAWPLEGADLMNKRVGVVGTGTSAAQVIPFIAQQAAQLTVFQRTPGYAIPLRNRRTTWEERHETPERYQAIRAAADMAFAGMAYDQPAPSALAVDDAERKQVYDKYHAKGAFQLLVSTFADLLTDEKANETAAQYVRDRIAERVADPKTAHLLTPRDYPYGARRGVMETGYYETFNRGNVALVDVRKAPIEEITETGLRTSVRHYDLDVLVLATGFDVGTGPILRLNVKGRSDFTLAQTWVDGPRTYLGLASHGFPNFFMIAGPQSPTPLANNFMLIEEQVEFVADVMKHMRDSQHSTFEASAESEYDWCQQVDAIAAHTLIPKADSWMMGTNIPGKARAPIGFFGGAPLYRQICAEVAAKGYRGFDIA
jgi:cation diffusion facilitator CzcD-associated flavoprotein CzcO